MTFGNYANLLEAFNRDGTATVAFVMIEAPGLNVTPWCTREGKVFLGAAGVLCVDSFLAASFIIDHRDATFV